MSTAKLLLITALVYMSCSVLRAVGRDALRLLQGVGSWPYGPAKVILLDANRLYAGAGGGIVIFDMSGPKPRELGRIATPGDVCGLALSGQRLLVADGHAGLVIYDVSEPTSPNLPVVWKKIPRVTSVVADGSFAYLAAEADGIRVLDLSTLSEVDKWLPPAGEQVSKLLLSSRRLYAGLTAVTSRVAAFEVSDAGKLRHSWSRTFSGEISDLASHGSRLYVLHNIVMRRRTRPYPMHTYLSEMDVTDPANPMLVRSLGPSEGAGSSLEVDGKYAYLASRQHGLWVVDLAGKSLSCAGSLPITERGSEAIARRGAMVALGVPRQDPKGVWLVDVSAPGAPKRVSHASLPHQAEGVFVAGNYAYVADGHDGLYILDVSDPGRPREVGHLEEPRMHLAEDVWVTGTEVYVADGLGLAIVDARDPAHPVMDSYVDNRPHDMAHWIEGCFRKGDYLYVAATAEIRIFDVSNPRDVSEVATLPARQARDVWVDGDFAYVADARFGLRVVDVSNPRLPVEVCAVPTVGQPFDVVAKDGYAYMTDSGAGKDGPGLGLVIFDVRKPAAARIVSNLYGPLERGNTKVEGLDVKNHIVYMTVVHHGLWEIDVSNADRPVHIGEARTRGAALNVKVVGDLAYVADYSHGISILRISDLGRKLPARPRPRISRFVHHKS